MTFFLPKKNIQYSFQNRQINARFLEYETRITIDRFNAPELIEFEKNMVILGINGSGKSKMGIFIDSICRTRNIPSIRIAPERISQFKSDFHGKFNEREELAPIMSARINANDNATGKTNSILHDLFIKRGKKNEEFRNLPDIPLPDKLDQIKKIFEEVMQPLKLTIEYNELFFSKDNPTNILPGQLSDGERASFHLIVQIISAPSQSVIVIDEPNSYLHSTLKAQLWLKLISVRSDCHFVFISHDLQFIRFLNDFKIIWVKSVDISLERRGGKIKWDWEEINFDDNESFPEIILRQLGYPCKNVLFIEGENKSLDYKLFSLLYPDFEIIPKQSCKVVMHSIQSLQNFPLFDKNYMFRGIIDRDFRSQDELNYLESSNIKALKVAEIENLFIVPEIVEKIVGYQNLVWSEIKDRYEYILLSRFQNQKLTQIKEAVEFQINSKTLKWQLTTTDSTLFQSEFNQYIQSIDFQKLIQNIEQQYNNASEIHQYLKLLNSKGIVTQVARLMGLQSADDYYRIVFGYLEKYPCDIALFDHYIPNF